MITSTCAAPPMAAKAGSPREPWQPGMKRISCATTPMPSAGASFWGVAWNDEWNPDVTRLGVYWRFSANHGKNWYPPQWLGIGPTCMHYSTGQFVGSDVRLYWQQFDPNTVADGYRTVTGHLTPDTQNPHVTLAAELPQEPEVGDSVHFLATATDNDTLSEVRVRLLANGEALAPILLTREAGVGYRGELQVPAPGFYQYRGEAEDFWENVGHRPRQWLAELRHAWLVGRRSRKRSATHGLYPDRVPESLQQYHAIAVHATAGGACALEGL